MMPTTRGVRGVAVLAAAIGWFGLLLQLVLSLRLARAGGRTLADGLVTYLAYFTILTNLLVAVALSAPLMNPVSAAGRFFRRPGVVTGVATAIALVGLAYHLLLRHVWDPQGWQLIADLVLHYATPVLFLAYWWMVASKARLGSRAVAGAVVYPTLYLVCMLVRGGWTGRYPYYFLDAAALGSVTVFANAAGLLAAVVAIALALAGVTRLRRSTGS